MTLNGLEIKYCCNVTRALLLVIEYVGCKSRTERSRKTKIGTVVAHVTRDLDTTFKVKWSRSPGCFIQCGLNARGRCSGDRENVLGMGNYCYVASAAAQLHLLGGARRWGTHMRRGAGHIMSPHTQLVLVRLSVPVHMIDWKDSSPK